MSKTQDIQEIISNTRFSKITPESIKSISTQPMDKIETVNNIAKDGLANINFNSFIKYGLIILILAILGFNLFTYLGKFTDTTAEIIKPIANIVGSTSGNLVKQTATVSGEGTKGLVDVASGTVVSGVDILQQNVSNNTTRNSIVRNNLDNRNDSDELYYKPTNHFIPVPDDAGSTTQASQNKSGYCYIGEDRGFRSCIQVSENDTCMSGQIFPTRALCINPNLRE
tara:strand:+ start:4758 stop:5435 length:678 start_codon:yes stop_codon:yes gene_type:complete